MLNHNYNMNSINADNSNIISIDSSISISIIVTITITINIRILLLAKSYLDVFWGDQLRGASGGREHTCTVSGGLSQSPKHPLYYIYIYIYICSLHLITPQCPHMLKRYRYSRLITELS